MQVTMNFINDANNLSFHILRNIAVGNLAPAPSPAPGHQGSASSRLHITMTTENRDFHKRTLPLIRTKDAHTQY